MKKRESFLSGDELKEIRRSCGLTQAQLAKILGVSLSSICAYETGRNAIPSKYLDQIFRLLFASPFRIPE